MKASRIAVLVVAVAAAGGAFMLANNPKPSPVPVAAPAPPPVPTDEVLVAAHDISMGTVVGDADITWQSWPRGGVSPGMIVKSADPKLLDDIKGAIARDTLFQGEPIHREKLIKGAGAGFLSATLPSGRRAVAINIDSNGATSAGGFIQPNDHVDVVHTFQDDTNRGGVNAAPFTSETILRNIRVLAIGPNVQEKNGQPVVNGTNATLDLTPSEAETVILAQRTGQLSLTLRSLLDAHPANEATANAGKQNLTIVRFGVAADGGPK